MHSLALVTYCQFHRHDTIDKWDYAEHSLVGGEACPSHRREVRQYPQLRCTDGWTDGQTNGWVGGWTDRLIKHGNKLVIFESRWWV